MLKLTLSLLRLVTLTYWFGPDIDTSFIGYIEGKIGKQIIFGKGSG